MPRTNRKPKQSNRSWEPGELAVLVVVARELPPPGDRVKSGGALPVTLVAFGVADCLKMVRYQL
jgi:hypothetical protein